MSRFSNTLCLSLHYAKREVYAYVFYFNQFILCNIMNRIIFIFTGTISEPMLSQRLIPSVTNSFALAEHRTKLHFPTSLAVVRTMWLIPTNGMWAEGVCHFQTEASLECVHVGVEVHTCLLSQSHSAHSMRFRSAGATMKQYVKTEELSSSITS